MTPKERTNFEVKFRVTPGCWLWEAASDRGYGRFNLQGVMIPAHRVAFMLYKGPIPATLQVRHTCDTPGCVNPDHLILGTQKDNMQDKKIRGRCHSNGPDHKPNAKLTETDAREIFDLSRSGPFSQAKIGKLYHISRATVSCIKRQTQWKVEKEGV